MAGFIPVSRAAVSVDNARTGVNDLISAALAGQLQRHPVKR
jgi:hypothetical protein